MSSHVPTRWPSSPSRLRGRERVARALNDFFRFGARVSSRYAKVEVSGANLTLHVEIEEAELDGGFIARCVELPGCMSQGETVQEALENIVDAIGGVLQARMSREVKRRELPELDEDLRNAAHRRTVEIPVA